MAVVVARYLADGDLDQTFGTQGKVRTDVDGASVVYDVHTNQQGKVTVLAGNRDLYRIRYAADGDLEGVTHMPFFSGAVDRSIGAATSYVPTQVVAPSAELAPSAEVPPLGPIATPGGRVVAVGWVIREGGHRQVEMAVAAYHHDGQPDTGFSGDGRLSLAFYATLNDDARAIAEARAIAVDNLERVIVSGYAINRGETDPDFAVARFLKNGNPDQQFSEDGRRITKFPGLESSSSSVISDRAGRIITAGGAWQTLEASQTRRIAIAKYTTTGELDNAFGGADGLVTATDGSPVSARAVKADRSRRLVVVGRQTGGPSHVAVARFLPNGILDQSFGGGGFGPFSPVPPPADAMDVHIDAFTGKITVVGQSQGQFAVIRLRDNGTFAPFGQNGSVITHMGTVNELSSAQAVAMDPYSRIVVAGVAGGSIQGVMRRAPAASEVFAVDE